MQKLVIAAGGTGGHIFPAVAVASAMKRQGWEILWLGSQKGMEAALVPQLGYAFAGLPAMGARGKGILGWQKALLLFPLAFWQALLALWRFRPQAVLAAGGYSTLAAGIASWVLRIPLAVHEQNAVAGWSNRILRLLAKKNLLGFEAQKGAWVGNPVRRDFWHVPAPKERYSGRTGPLRVLVLGGSQGAKALNEIVPCALALFPKGALEILHQCGRAWQEETARAYTNLGREAKVVPFINDMAQAMSWADVAISRAGASTLAELAAVGVGAVLVPFPFAVDDHQTKNALIFAQKKAALLLPQEELTPERLFSLLASMDRADFLGLAENAQALARPQATEDIIHQIEEMSHSA